MAGYGLRPVGTAGGSTGGYSTGGFAEYRIDVSAVGTGKIYTGDFVELTSTGEIVRQNGSTGESPTTTNRTLGAAVGFRWVTSYGEQKYSQKYVGDTANTEAYAYVADDPNQVYMIQADGAVTFADIGSNAPVAGFAESSADDSTGNSGIQLDQSLIATTSTLALRIVGVPENGENENSSTPNVLVKLNTGVSQLTNGTGV